MGLARTRGDLGFEARLQWYHFGVGAPPILVYFSGDWDVHWGYGILTHGMCHCACVAFVEGAFVATQLRLFGGTVASVDRLGARRERDLRSPPLCAIIQELFAWSIVCLCREQSMQKIAATSTWNADQQLWV